MTPSAAVAVPDPNIAIETAPGEGNFDATVMMERFNQQMAAKEAATEVAVDKPVETGEQVEKPATTEEKKLEIPEDFPHPEKATEKSVARWNDLKKAAEELQELKEKQLPLKEKELQERLIEIEEAKKKLAEFEGKDLSQYEKRIKELEERDAEHEKNWALHDVTKTTAFQKEVVERAEAIGNEIDEIAISYELDIESLKGPLLSAIREVEESGDNASFKRKVRELTHSLSLDPGDSDAVRRLATDLREVFAKEKYVKENADVVKRELEFIKETEDKKKAEADEAAFKSANEAVEKQIAEKFAFLKEHPEVLEAMKSSKFEDTPANRALAAKLAPLVTKLNDLYMAEKQQTARLQEEMAKRNSAKPNVSTNVNQPVKEATPEPGGLDWESSWNRFQKGQAA